MALGAQMRDVIRHVVGDGLMPVTLGVVVGVLLSLAGGKLVASLLYGVTPGDPSAISVVAGVLLVVATFAALVPAWRASRVDPLIALRIE